MVLYGISTSLMVISTMSGASGAALGLCGGPKAHGSNFVENKKGNYVLKLLHSSAYTYHRITLTHPRWVWGTLTTDPMEQSYHTGPNSEILSSLNSVLSYTFFILNLIWSEQEWIAISYMSYLGWGSTWLGHKGAKTLKRPFCFILSFHWLPSLSPVRAR